MLQDPNVERVIKNYTEPLQKQISMMQIELEEVKLQLPDVRQYTLADKLKYWFICRKKGHTVSRVHPKYPSQYCSICSKHRSEF